MTPPFASATPQRGCTYRGRLSPEGGITGATTRAGLAWWRSPAGARRRRGGRRSQTRHRELATAKRSGQRGLARRECARQVQRLVRPPTSSEKSRSCLYGAASRRRSDGSPVAMTAAANSRAVATTNASTACCEDSLARARMAPARCAVRRVRSETPMPRPLRRWFTAASNRAPRQTSASTGAGMRTSAPRSCATPRIARARWESTLRSAARASEWTASASRISASAKLASRSRLQPSERAHESRRARQETRAAVRAPARGPLLARRIPTGHETRRGGERPSPSRTAR